MPSDTKGQNAAVYLETDKPENARICEKSRFGTIRESLVLGAPNCSCGEAWLTPNPSRRVR
jgi:hypothetical protein